jgi:DHA2 family multidrug resistance protein-like MFS transporter
VAIYRSRLAADLPPSVPAEAATAARDTLGRAVDVAAQLPGGPGAVLLDAARGAFVDGMQITSAIAAAVAVGLVVVTVVALRSRGAAPGDPASEAQARSDTAQVVPT